MMTQKFLRTVAFLVSLATSLAGARAAEEKIEFPATSQHAVVKQRVGLTDFEIDYSRPNKNQRQIFGALVPFNQLWRTGANAPTRLKISSAIKVDGKDLPAGEYAIFTIPGEKQWKVIFSKDAKVQSAADYKEANDAARVTIEPATLNEAVETFTIGFSDLRTASAKLVFDWDTSRVAVPITTDAVEKLMQQIDAAVKSEKEQDPGFYYSAASFYFDQSKDLTQASKWADQAIAKSPKAWFMHYKKAQIEAKLGHKAEAIAAADSAMQILNAQPTRDEASLRLVSQLIDSQR